MHHKTLNSPYTSTGSNAIARAVFLLGVLASCDRASAQAHQPPKQDQDGYVWEHTANPFAGDATVIAEGRRLYRSTCYICHADTGSRGPNLRRSKLKGQQFLRIVMNGRKGTQMPAWKGKLSEEEMWKILAFIEAPADAPSP
jgi:mono/diheme cytochrome c family protein